MNGRTEKLKKKDLAKQIKTMMKEMQDRHKQELADFDSQNKEE